MAKNGSEKNYRTITELAKTPYEHHPEYERQVDICPLIVAKQVASNKTSKIWNLLPRESLSSYQSFTKQLQYR